MNFLFGEQEPEETTKLIQNESQEVPISINEEENEQDFYNENATRFEVTFYRWIQLASYIFAFVVNAISLVSFTPIGSQVLMFYDINVYVLNSIFII